MFMRVRHGLFPPFSRMYRKARIKTVFEPSTEKTVLLSDVLGKRIEKITLRVEQFPARGAFQVIVRAAVFAGFGKLIARSAVPAEELAHRPLRAQLVKMPVNRRLPDGFARFLQQAVQLLRRQMPPAVLAQQALYRCALLGFVRHIFHNLFPQQTKMKTIFNFA